jgi:hypothetical protein
MKKTTRKAIQASEQHWLENEKGLTSSYSGSDCELCQEFYIRRGIDCRSMRSQSGCPVFLMTGQRSCLGSPYADLMNHIKTIEKEKEHIGDYYSISAKECCICSRLCREEKEFLHSLLSWQRFLHRGYGWRVMKSMWNSFRHWWGRWMERSSRKRSTV